MFNAAAHLPALEEVTRVTDDTESDGWIRSPKNILELSSWHVVVVTVSEDAAICQNVGSCFYSDSPRFLFFRVFLPSPLDGETL